MDIYSYINSPDVAKHCREINKIWTPFEMAALISRSDRHTIHEKHSAWHELMKEYSDMPTTVSHMVKSYESFHEKLVELIDYEERTLALFMTAEAGAVYSYRAWWYGEYKRSESVYTTYDKVWAAVREEWERDETFPIVVSKILPDSMGRIDVYVNYDGDPYSINIFYDDQTRLQWYPHLPSDESWAALADARTLFQSQYLVIPVPFKRGDILTIAQTPLYKADNPLILLFDGLNCDDPVKDGDDTDMLAWGVSVDGNGQLYNNHITHHDQLVYFAGKLEGTDALLHYVSLYMKDQIDLPELLAAYRQILFQP